MCQEYLLHAGDTIGEVPRSGHPPGASASVHIPRSPRAALQPVCHTLDSELNSKHIELAVQGVADFPRWQAISGKLTVRPRDCHEEAVTASSCGSRPVCDCRRWRLQVQPPASGSLTCTLQRRQLQRGHCQRSDVRIHVSATRTASSQQWGIEVGILYAHFDAPCSTADARLAIYLLQDITLLLHYGSAIESLKY